MSVLIEGMDMPEYEKVMVVYPDGCTKLYKRSDMSEVVYCKDCDLWNECNKAGHEQTGNYVCSCEYFSNEDGYVVYTRPDDYCSYGERKEGE